MMKFFWLVVLVIFGILNGILAAVQVRTFWYSQESEKVVLFHLDDGNEARIRFSSSISCEFLLEAFKYRVDAEISHLIAVDELLKETFTFVDGSSVRFCTGPHLDALLHVIFKASNFSEEEYTEVHLRDSSEITFLQIDNDLGILSFAGLTTTVPSAISTVGHPNIGDWILPKLTQENFQLTQFTFERLASVNVVSVDGVGESVEAPNDAVTVFHLPTRRIWAKFEKNSRNLVMMSISTQLHPGIFTLKNVGKFLGGSFIFSFCVALLRFIRNYSSSNEPSRRSSMKIDSKKPEEETQESKNEEKDDSLSDSEDDEVSNDGPTDDDSTEDGDKIQEQANSVDDTAEGNSSTANQDDIHEPPLKSSNRHNSSTSKNGNSKASKRVSSDETPLQITFALIFSLFGSALF